MLELQKLIYGDRSLVLSTLSTSTSTENIVNPVEVSKFLITLNEMGYVIKNIDNIFKLSVSDFESFQEELFTLFDSLKIEGFIFRKRFAKSIKMKDYSNKEWITMFAQYSVTYGWTDVYSTVFGKNAEDVLKDFFKPEDSVSELKTNLKEFKVSFDLKNDLKEILVDILSSKIVLRDQQIRIIEVAPMDILTAAYSSANITIKETEIYVFKRILSQNEIDSSYFKDIDQIVRIIVNMYAFDRENFRVKNNKVLLDDVGQINNTMLKTLVVKIPTKLRKVITKALNSQRDTDYVVERMFKYYGFWKKIFTALKWQGEDKTSLKYPVFKEIKDKLYTNDRSNSFNGRVEAAKFIGDYDKAVRIMAENPGYLMRNIMEYLRYSEGTSIAKKTKREIYKDPNRWNNYTDDELFSTKICIGDLINPKSKKELRKEPEHPQRTIKVQKDASKFFASEDFVDTLSKTNTKLLWQSLSLFDNESLYEDRSHRIVQGKNISYERKLPGIKNSMVKDVKKSIKKAINTIKKEENISLGKVFIEDNIKNYNVQFSGRTSKGLTLSGEYLTPGSKIPFSELIGENKIIRLGIAWRGTSSCDIDHSLNLLDKDNSVYYGNPTYKVGKKVIISSSGDITSNGSEMFSTELIDIDLDLAMKENIGDMITSAIMFSGMNLNNYEVFWFMNIIDKKDRVLDGRRIEIALDKMDYAIQVNEESMSMLGFFINMKDGNLEVLNMALGGRQQYRNAITNHEQFTEALKNREPLIPMDKALKNVISKEQRVSSIDDANIIICSKEPEEMDVNKTYITPGKHGEKINQIIF